MSVNTTDLPVRPGEEPWTDAELKEVQAELESEAASLHADLAKAASDIAERLTDSVRDAGDDSADAGTQLPLVGAGTLQQRRLERLERQRVAPETARPIISLYLFGIAV